ncbi:MAG: DNA translocase FtsK 4TM domain-containing protein [Pseudomonadota bacterium]|nr:DNA translocase FtsK 4TM domain-containing protein [Pseudomonadota bacterium]
MAQARRNKKFTLNKLTSIKKEISSFFMLVFSLLFLISIYSHDPGDPNFFNSGIASSVNNYIGIVGAYVSFVFFEIFGFFSYLFPVFLILVVLESFKENSFTKQPIVRITNFFYFLLIIFSSCVILNFLGPEEFSNNDGFLFGGFTGFYLTNHIGIYIGTAGTLLLSVATLILSASKYFNIDISLVSMNFYKYLKYGYLRIKFIFNSYIEKISLYIEKKKHRQEVAQTPLVKKVSETALEIPEETKHVSKREFKEKQKDLFLGDNKSDLPLLDFLIDHGSEKVSYDDQSLHNMSTLLEANLKDFNIEAEVKNVRPGPVVTLFEIQPAKGIKVSQIISLSKDLARTMSVSSLRVVDNIPGTASIGIEIPNDVRETVSLRDIIISKEYESSKSSLTIALGKDIQGSPVCTDLHKLPHLLVAGTTGSGKSVAIHSMIMSLLYKSKPSDLQLLLVDPKMLELSVYDGIPHLLNPVITDMKQAVNGLRWCVQQMEKRYRMMSELGVRNIRGYNKIINDKMDLGKKIELNNNETESYHEKLPYIVVVIDEFADMMSVIGKKVDDLITRIAHKARAAGIHLILATQRPSVDVITGIIKANISARIALQVSSHIDSRTIIDSMGAEQLLGNGDMLFVGPTTRTNQRIHGAYVSDKEVKDVVDFLKKNGEASYIESLLTDDDDQNNGVDINSNDDELFAEAVKLVTETRKTSISFLQRRLKIGYNRAANLIESMESQGILSAPQSNGNRDILKDKD